LTHLCEVTYGKTERNTPYRITIIRVPGKKLLVGSYAGSETVF